MKFHIFKSQPNHLKALLIFWIQQVVLTAANRGSLKQTNHHCPLLLSYNLKFNAEGSIFLSQNAKYIKIMQYCSSILKENQFIFPENKSYLSFGLLCPTFAIALRLTPEISIWQWLLKRLLYAIHLDTAHINKSNGTVLQQDWKLTCCHQHKPRKNHIDLSAAAYIGYLLSK